jgi:transposase
MIALTPHLRVLVATAPADFGCGIDGLARRVRQVLADNPFSGAVFVFRNRRRTHWRCCSRVATTPRRAACRRGGRWHEMRGAYVPAPLPRLPLFAGHF